MPHDNPSELFVQVDENDNLIGPVSRKLAHEDNTIIAQRHQAGPLGHVGGGGHVNGNETYQEAAKKEMKEELGISIPLNI